ncbi:hypothetical protein K8Z61_11985 [Nocardioides sp. TRM66260-LWL]|uniref:hypothetical protein n=1 Tax=Nocardioides sp. TRM66260-LWL TaxID=2874478 RepID=UPI001CC777A1|nr:hypothetical protein [Nocardioides sp. TRM66260-LWL]MBZ5735216.1 hypothetical protein [Nocardioides sp. TRM66260-LWL]
MSPRTRRILRADRVGAVLALVPFLVGAGVGANAATGVPSTPVATVQDSSITESSGLVVDGDRFVTTNDSGDTGRVFTLDRTGRTVGVTYWAASPTDVEALAPAGSGQVWVADIGDNDRRRQSISVARIPVGPGTRRVEPTIFQLTYPDSAQDAESLVVDPRTGRLYVVTKGFTGGVVFAAPEVLSADGQNRLTPVGSTIPIATDAAFFPDGRHLVVRGYGSATVYAWPGLRRVGSFDLPRQRQGEGIAVDGRNRVFLSSEGRDQPILRITLPPSVRAAVAGGATSSSAPAPAAAPTEIAAPMPGISISGWGLWALWGGILAGGVFVLTRALRPN